MPISYDFLRKTKITNIFVETGSNQGDTIQLALDVGYEKVLSIECKKEFYEKCIQRFQGNPKVSLFRGDSSVDLFAMIKDIKEPITFWLDAHFMPNDPAQKLSEHPGEGKIPLVEELNQIRQHPIKTHYLIIDDLDSLEDLSPRQNAPPTGSMETMTNNLIKQIQRINKDYFFFVLNIPNFAKLLLCKVF